MQHPVVSREEWIAARKALLVKEKQLTRQRDQVSAERRNLPWVKIDKPYLFDGPSGKESLADLFDGRSQLVLQHFMFGPDWEEGCVGCSFGADHVDSARQHFEQRDLSFVAVSRAPLAKIDSFKRRMGWRFKWVSSLGSDFNYDFGVSFTKEQLATGKVVYNYEPQESQSEELSGVSLFYKDEAGTIFHTYATYARGDEMLSSAYMYLDLAPKGRDEGGLPCPSAWWRHHDKYEDSRAKAGGANCCASAG
jgi:predicted dithiol-disulfide oxidoreductase (DUF899 family)